MAPPIVIYGRRGCGKTAGPEQLKTLFGAQHVVDGFDWALPGHTLSDDTLYLTNALPPVQYQGAVIISYDPAPESLNPSIPKTPHPKDAAPRNP